MHTIAKVKACSFRFLFRSVSQHGVVHKATFSARGAALVAPAPTTANYFSRSSRSHGPQHCERLAGSWGARVCVFRKLCWSLLGDGSGSKNMSEEMLHMLNVMYEECCVSFWSYYMFGIFRVLNRARSDNDTQAARSPRSAFAMSAIIAIQRFNDKLIPITSHQSNNIPFNSKQSTPTQKYSVE